MSWDSVLPGPFFEPAPFCWLDPSSQMYSHDHENTIVPHFDKHVTIDLDIQTKVLAICEGIFIAATSRWSNCSTFMNSSIQGTPFRGSLIHLGLFGCFIILSVNALTSLVITSIGILLISIVLTMRLSIS